MLSYYQIVNIFLCLIRNTDKECKQLQANAKKTKQPLVLATLLMLLSACNNPSQPEYQRSISWARTSPWLIADLHTHSNFSDGSLSVKELIDEAATAGCDVIALTDHSDMVKQVTTASPAYFSELEQLRIQRPELVIIGGIEWNIPSYNGREHVNLLISPEIDPSILTTFRERFDAVGSSSYAQQGTSITANTALKWLSTQLSRPDQAVLFYNHPSRKVKAIEESSSDILQWRAINNLMIGFEGGPGHQHTENTGSYNQQFRTEDRWDPVVSEIGGVWDNLLDQGENIWAALANSDFHNRKLDYLPCAFSRTHIQTPDKSINGVLKGLRAGSFWADHGRILNKLVFSVKTPGLDLAATPGEIIKINKFAPLEVKLAIARGQGAINASLIAELISNCIDGKPGLLDAQAIGIAQNTASWSIEQPRPGGDENSCYLRVRVRKQNSEKPDLMAYSNPVRVTFLQDNWSGTMPQKHQLAVASINTKNNASPGNSRTHSPIAKEDNINIEQKPEKSSRLSQESHTYLVVIVVIILIALIIFGLIYFSRSNLDPNNSKTDLSENLQYDSKISLFSLIFDRLNSILHISHGRASSSINFVDISKYEVIANSICLLKIDRNDTKSFGIEMEESLRLALNELDKEKLLEKETRQLELIIFSDPASGVQPVLVNFYYREGAHRLSYHSFARSVDDIVFWCSLLESAIRPIANEGIETVVRTDQHDAESLNSPHQTHSEILLNTETSQALQSNYNLADELTNLAKLKEQGFLSDEEFQKAKDKILSDHT